MATQLLCSRCKHRPPADGRRLCDHCLTQERNKQRQRRVELKRRNLCFGCGERPPVPRRVQCAQCLAKSLAYTNRYRARNLDEIKIESRRRYEILRNVIHSHYGSQCVCCDEREPEFLAIDHIDGIVREGPKKFTGRQLYRWLQTNGFPDGYRLLCHNCNFAVRNGRQCPHKGRKD